MTALFPSKESKPLLLFLIFCLFLKLFCYTSCLFLCYLRYHIKQGNIINQSDCWEISSSDYTAF